jgi:hypothetical protein
MTGRKRAVKQPSGKQLGRKLIDDDDSVDVSKHPAIVSKKKPNDGASKQPRKRKSAVRRPVTVVLDAGTDTEQRSSVSGRSKTSRRAKDEIADVGKVSRKRSTSRKKQAKAKNSNKRRKRR